MLALVAGIAALTSGESSLHESHHHHSHHSHHKKHNTTEQVVESDWVADVSSSQASRDKSGKFSSEQQGQGTKDKLPDIFASVINDIIKEENQAKSRTAPAPAPQPQTADLAAGFAKLLTGNILNNHGQLSTPFRPSTLDSMLPALTATHGTGRPAAPQPPMTPKELMKVMTRKDPVFPLKVVNAFIEQNQKPKVHVDKDYMQNVVGPEVKAQMAAGDVDGAVAKWKQAYQQQQANEKKEKEDKKKAEEKAANAPKQVTLFYYRLPGESQWRVDPRGDDAPSVYTKKPAAGSQAAQAAQAAQAMQPEPYVDQPRRGEPGSWHQMPLDSANAFGNMASSMSGGM